MKKKKENSTVDQVIGIFLSHLCCIFLRWRCLCMSFKRSFFSVHSFCYVFFAFMTIILCYDLMMLALYRTEIRRNLILLGKLQENPINRFIMFIHICDVNRMRYNVIYITCSMHFILSFISHASSHSFHSLFLAFRFFIFLVISFVLHLNDIVHASNRANKITNINRRMKNKINEPIMC